VISSSSIRQALLNGDVQLANSLLGHPFLISGIVVHGEERGRLLGYPTANILVSDDYLIPKHGVYAVWAYLEGKRVFGMMSIGRKPTFHDKYATVIEVNFFDFQGDLYDSEINVHIEARLRDERKFNGVNELIKQLKEDQVEAEHVLQEILK